MIYTSDRLFQTWDYTVSHQQLLIRSPISPDQATNIDIIFLGIAYLGIPSRFHGLELDQASPDESSAVLSGLRKGSNANKVYTLFSEGRRYYLVGVAFKIYENNLDLFESSLEYFSDKDRSRQAGQLLLHSGMAPQVS